MAEASPKPFASDAKIEEFQRYLASSDRILALLGAGLSASSGLPTFRGAGGMWRNYQSTDLATPEAFCEDPGLVWQFYSYRKHMALQAQPNPAHYALAELARKKPNFVTLSQNVDGEHLCIASLAPWFQGRGSLLFFPSTVFVILGSFLLV